MTYEIRSKTGELKAKISHNIAQVIIDSAKGEFFKEQGHTCFKITVACVYEMQSYGRKIESFLWVGDSLYPV